VLLQVGVTAAQDNELVDALEELEQQKQEQNLTELQQNISFETFSSCEDMTTTLEDFIKDNFKDNRGY
jgi:hypothetical protein